MDAEAMLKTFVVALLEGSILTLAKINPVELPILIRPSDDRERIPAAPGPRSHHSPRDGFDNWSGARGACNRSREVLHEPGVANLTKITAFSFCGYRARAECV